MTEKGKRDRESRDMMMMKSDHYPVPKTASNVKAQIVSEIYQNARQRFPRRRVCMFGINETLQIDLMDLRNLSRFNSGHKFALVSICIFSKKLHVIPLKTKTTNEVTNAMKSILTEIMPPRVHNIWSDRGTEFTSKKFKDMLDTFGIKLNHSNQITKANIAERVIRTIKTWLFKRMLYFKTKRWIDHIEHIVNYYNNHKVHRTIGMTPNEVGPHNEQKLLNTVYNYKQELPSIGKSKFKVGDHVRISKYKTTFARGFHPQYSPEIFKVLKIQSTVPLTYLLVDANGDAIQGTFYAEELVKVKYPESYIVEKILKKNGNRIYAKYLGIENPFWSKIID